MELENKCKFCLRIPVSNSVKTGKTLALQEASFHSLPIYFMNSNVFRTFMLFYCPKFEYILNCNIYVLHLKSEYMLFFSILCLTNCNAENFSLHCFVTIGYLPFYFIVMNCVLFNCLKMQYLMILFYGTTVLFCG